MKRASKRARKYTNTTAAAVALFVLTCGQTLDHVQANSMDNTSSSNLQMPSECWLWIAIYSLPVLAVLVLVAERIMRDMPNRTSSANNGTQNTSSPPGDLQAINVMTPWLPSLRGENLELYFVRKFGENWAQNCFDVAYSDLGLLLLTEYCCYRVIAPYDLLYIKGMRLLDGLPVLEIKDSGNDQTAYATIWTGEVELVKLPSSTSTSSQSSASGSGPPSPFSEVAASAPPTLPVGLNSITPHSVVVSARVNSVPVRFDRHGSQPECCSSIGCRTFIVQDHSMQHGGYECFRAHH